MKTGPVIITCSLAGMFLTHCLGQTPLITSFGKNGELSWTNSVVPQALYRVEWAAQADGPWYRTFDNLITVDGQGAAAFTVAVPMFYRVAMETNEPPQGMVWIEAGEVVLGDTQGVGGTAERPVHTNFIGGFWMDEMEVTRTKWAEVFSWAVSNGYSFLSFADAGETNQQPVQLVNWIDCILWCNARSQKEGLNPCYYTDDAHSRILTNALPPFCTNWTFGNASVDWTAHGYRLPTEAEWEKAARGRRQGRMFPWGGDTIQHARANYYATNSFAYDTSPTSGFHPYYLDRTEGAQSSPAGAFPSNGYGLHDMAGNVWEWCWDRYAPYSTTFQTDPRGPETGNAMDDRVLRGGSYSENAFHLRCAARKNENIGIAYGDYGFRCVRTGQ